MAVGTVAGGAGAGRSGKEAGGEKAASTARLLRTVLSWDFFHMLALSKVLLVLPMLLPSQTLVLPFLHHPVPLPPRLLLPTSDSLLGFLSPHCPPHSPPPVTCGTGCGRAEREGDGAKDAALADAEAGGEAAATEGMEVDGGEVGEGEATAEGAAEAAAEEAEVEAEAEGELEGGEEEDELREVPVQFSSAEEYVDVFERLLLEECRAQILRGAEEQGGMESHLVVAVRCERANEFHMVGVASKEALVADCHDNDLLLLSKEKPWGGSALPNTYAIASVESRETKTSLRLRLCLEDPWQWADPGGPPTTAAAPDEEQAGGTAAGGEGTEAGPAAGKAKGRRWGVRQRARANRMLSFLMGAAATGGSACWVSKLCNTSTISREYAALRSAPTLPYIRTVLASHMPAPGHTQAVAAAGGSGGAGGAGGGVEDEEEGGAGAGQGKQQQWRVPEGLMEHLSASHNESQLRAIKGGLSRRPLVLIQGPPGTGKTQAILGLLSVVLHGRPAHEMGDASNGAQHITHMTRLTWQQRQQQWVQASPWLHGVNPREAVQPDDEEEGGAGSSGGNVFGSTQQVEVLGGHRKQRAHVLVCAPSNAALDEIVLRLLHTGLRDDIGGIYSPSVVRVGLNAHHSVASVAMDNLVGAWGGWDGRGGVRRRVCYAMDAWRYVCYAMDAWRYVCYAITSPLSPSLLSSSLHFSPLIQDQRISQRASSMAWSATGMGATTTGAHNIFSPSHHNFSSTLSSFPLLPFPLSSLSSPPHRYPSVPAAWRGSGVFSRMSRPFDVVVIDEAAQAVEPSTLIPMTHGCSQVFMVGDPLQLPATVLSTRAVHYGYHGSMFSRLQQAGYPVVMLNTQYRMHPMIRHFPSHEFYGGALRDAPQMAQNTARPWHAERVFGPLFFFDLHQSKDEQPPGGSWMNTDEAEFVMVLYRHLVALYPQLKESSDVGVISPYKHQVKLLRDKFRELLGEGAHRVDVNTVDGFQGREKDVIIFSCVRAGRGKGKSIGFLSDFRRMNVGITRARSSMLVVANAAALMVDEHWGNLVKHARSTNRYLKVSRPFHRIFASDHLEKMRALAHAEGEGEEGASGVAAGGAAAGAPPASAGPAFKKAPTPEDYGGKLDKGDGGVGGEGDTVAEGEGEDEEGQGAMGGEEELEVAVEVGDFDEDNIDGEGSVLFFPCYTSCPSALPPASLVSCF
ncbi:unnamed protein product [Closterium sp. NIES-54]